MQEPFIAKNKLKGISILRIIKYHNPDIGKSLIVVFYQMWFWITPGFTYFSPNWPVILSNIWVKIAILKLPQLVRPLTNFQKWAHFEILIMSSSIYD